MGFGFKDSGGTDYKDSGVGYRAALGEGINPKVGYKESHGGTQQQGFGLKGFVPGESGGLKTKATAPDPAEIARRIAEEKEKSQKAFEKREREQKQWEQKQFEQKKQNEQRQFEERQRQEQRACDEKMWQEKNRQN